MAKNLHRDLAARLGGETARILLAQLPRVAEACERGVARSTVPMKFIFRVLRSGELVVELHPRKEIPLDPIVHKISVRQGQLSLFEGADAEEA